MSEEKTKDEKPTKFEAKISASDKSIKGERAKVLARKVRRSAEDKVRALDTEIENLETLILDLTDLAPDTTYSLRPTGKDFDADGWVDKLYTANLDLKLKKIELEVAKGILTEWF